MTKAISSASAEAASGLPSRSFQRFSVEADHDRRRLARHCGRSRARSGPGASATFGVRRYGFNELVTKLAAVPLARRDQTVASPLSVEAIAARAAFELADDLE
jgi:hypothetical protein